jgi:hypothetical protein
MRRENLRAIQTKSFKPQTTDSKHGLTVCANLVRDRSNAPAGCGEVFVGDITYLRLADGSFCYLACLQDKFTRRIVGWKVSTRMTAQLVIDVFQQARRRGLIGKGAIIHRDGSFLKANSTNPLEFAFTLNIYQYANFQKKIIANHNRDGHQKLPKHLLG